MRKWILAALAVSVVFLGGCTSTSDPAPTVTVTAQATPTQSIEDMIVDAYEQEYGSIGGVGREALVELSYTICEFLDKGNTVEDIMVAAQGTGLTYDQVGFITGAAVTGLCQQHLPYLNDWIAANTGYSA